MNPSRSEIGPEKSTVVASRDRSHGYKMLSAENAKAIGVVILPAAHLAGSTAHRWRISDVEFIFQVPIHVRRQAALKSATERPDRKTL
jgi:hypothetical protein